VDALETNGSKIRVRYAETDKMGIVYHANYYIWFEVSRADFIRNFGITYKDMEKQGVGMPVISTDCIYKSPAYYDDLLTVKASIEEMSPTRIKFKYEVYRDCDEKLLAVGHTAHAFVNSLDGRPINLKKKHEALYNLLCKCSNKEEG
jgi:acyl-CoA thioester hydrolase